MSLDLTRAEFMDRVAKAKPRPTRATLLLAVVFLLVFAAVFGVMYPDPIHTYYLPAH